MSDAPSESTVTAEMIVGYQKRFVALAKDREQLELELATAKKEMASLHPALLDHFIKQGIQRLTVDERTIYVRREWRCYVKEGQSDTLVRSMEQREDMKMMVKKGFNTQSLWAWLRGLPRLQFPDGTPNDNGEPIMPSKLGDLLDVRRIDELRVVK